MKIDDSVFRQYVEGKDISNHWVFKEIDDCYAFSGVDENNIEVYKEVHRLFLETLADFKLLNEKYIQLLFPNYKQILDKVTILLVIGIQNPYDAFFFDYQNQEYMCFDIARFSKYRKDDNEAFQLIIRRLLTHEFIHSCVHEDYPYLETMTYKEKINRTLFDEGIAHLLAYQEDVINIELSEYQEYADKATEELTIRYDEENKEKQDKNLEEGTSGRYWDKYLCVIGKFYFYAHRNNLIQTYKMGYDGIVESILCKEG